MRMSSQVGCRAGRDGPSGGASPEPWDTIAGVQIDHPIRGPELVRRMREPRDQHGRTFRRPGQPRKAAGKAYEQVGVLEPARALSRRAPV